MFFTTACPNDVRIPLALGTYVKECHYPAKENSPAYRWYNAYFNGQKNRFLAISKQFPGEFDDLRHTSFMLDDELVSPPQLWVRVTKHPSLGLWTVPVWRGSLPRIPCDSDGFLIAETDDVVTYHLNQMHAASGVNLIEIAAWMEKLDRAKAIQNANAVPIPNNPGSVN